MENKLYFIGLKAFIFNDKNELLVLEGSSKMEVEGLWSLPGGRINEDEDITPLTEILLREVKEECGSIEIELISTPVTCWRFHINAKSVFLVGFVALYKSGEITLSEEHVNYRWLNEKDIDALQYVEGYREAIEEVFRLRN